MDANTGAEAVVSREAAQMRWYVEAGVGSWGTAEIRVKAEAATAGPWDAAETESKAEAGAVVSCEAAEMRWSGEAGAAASWERWRLMQRLQQQYHARQQR